MAAKKKSKKKPTKTKKKPKKAQKRVRRVKLPTRKKYPVAGCQTRGTWCQKHPGLYRTTPKKPN